MNRTNEKLKILLWALLMVMIAIIAIYARRLIIIYDLTNKAEKSAELFAQNACYKMTYHSASQIAIKETYIKEDKTLVKVNTYKINGEDSELVMYKSKDEIFGLSSNGKEKRKIFIGKLEVMPTSICLDFSKEEINLALFAKIEKTKINNKDCYLIRTGTTEQFIDADTGLTIKLIDNNENSTTDYNISFGTVQESDITKPDTTGYIEK